MRHFIATFIAVSAFLAAVPIISADARPASLARYPDLGIGADLHGALPFALDSAWNTRVDTLPVRSDSAALIIAMGWAEGLHAEFGSGLYDGDKIGIPYVVVPENQQLVPVTLDPYPDQGDAGPYPIPPTAQIESENAKDSDRHVIVVQRDAKSPNGLGELYELFRAFRPPAGGPSAWRGYGCIFDMRKGDLQRPDGWTSADAAGLPIFPGLVRYEDVKRAVDQAGRNGVIPHAFRYTVDGTRTAWKVIAPAQHVAGANDGRTPFGVRVRLRASWQTPPDWPDWMAVLVNTLKTYGMIMADNGGAWFVTGAPDERWDNDILGNLRKIKPGDFEVVNTGTPRAMKP